MHGNGDKRSDHPTGTDADAVFGDFTVPEDADVQTGDADAGEAAEGEDES